MCSVAVADISESLTIDVTARKQHIEGTPQIDNGLCLGGNIFLWLAKRMHTAIPDARTHPGILRHDRDNAGLSIQLGLGKEFGAVAVTPVAEDGSGERPFAIGDDEVCRNASP